MAFHRAGSEAVKAALATTGTRLLEPVMEVAIHAPSGNVGDVVGDLNRRQGRVASIEDHGAQVEVLGYAPLARLAGYTTALRSLTQGRASSDMRFNGYEEVQAA
ncbi:Elongation factor G [compost metagenome]